MDSIRIGIPRFLCRFDLNRSKLLPPTWKYEIESTVNRMALEAQLGGHSSSLEPEGTILKYRLVDGVAIRSHLPWLDDLYKREFLSRASEVYGEQLAPSDQVQNGVNINVIQGPTQRYERHVDTNPLTGLLFVTTHGPEEGGQLVFRGDADRLECEPQQGHLLLFDARDAPHEVTPLVSDTVRISVPMNYFTKEALAARPHDLDHYLYGDIY
jgi:hypothetical protein